MCVGAVNWSNYVICLLLYAHQYEYFTILAVTSDVW